MAVEFKDYYKILGVDRNADDKTIKSAYRRLARKFHPDVAKGKDKGEHFKEISEAYEVLSDPAKRRRYDTLGPDWQRYAQAPPGGPGPGDFRVEHGDVGNFSDFFRTIFGDSFDPRGGGFDPRGGGGARMGRGRGPAGPRGEDWFGGRSQGQDVQAAVEITLEEAFAGTRKTFTVEVEEPCPTCQGSGNVGGKPCATCHGRGWQRSRREVDVRIPAGVRTGQRVRVAGEGGGGTGGRGDLYLMVTVGPHRVFERKGDDLHVSLPITAPEAALGTTLAAPTLRGKVSMKIPPGTSSGRTFRLPGYGMPRLRGTGAGDQLVKVRIVMPAELTREERELYEKLGALRTDDPRAYQG